MQHVIAHALTEYLHLEGLIRESGPHLVFGLAVGAAGLLLGL